MLTCIDFEEFMAFGRNRSATKATAIGMIHSQRKIRPDGTCSSNHGCGLPMLLGRASLSLP